MQNSVLKSLRGCALSLLSLVFIAVASCSSDDEPAVTPDPQNFSGSFVTTIPSMPNFAPVDGTNQAKVTWLNPEQTAATVSLGAFTIETGMPGRNYEIGAMEITGVKCVKAANGSISLSNSSFSCQAGNFATTGSLEGTLSQGKLTFTIVYKPGSMPFDVKSVFTSK